MFRPRRTAGSLPLLIRLRIVFAWQLRCSAACLIVSQVRSVAFVDTLDPLVTRRVRRNSYHLGLPFLFLGSLGLCRGVSLLPEMERAS